MATLSSDRASSRQKRFAGKYTRAMDPISLTYFLQSASKFVQLAGRTLRVNNPLGNSLGAF
jgi:hypothetical protein